MCGEKIQEMKSERILQRLSSEVVTRFMTILEAIHDHNLFRPLFKNLDTWRAWLVVLKAIFALGMTEEERTIFKELSGRETPPEPPTELLGSGHQAAITGLGLSPACQRRKQLTHTY